MTVIGAHLSSAKGYLHMGKTAVSIGANTFQFFTRNPRGGKAKELNMEDIRSYQEYAAAHGIPVVLAHAPYTLNAAAAEGRTREFAWETMADDMRRMEALPGQLYNFHPGSHVWQGVEADIELIAVCIDQAVIPGQTTTILLETMAGKGSEVGSRFEELRAILDRVKYPEYMGVCLDTCHVYDAGYDIRDHLDEVLEEFDRIVGLDRLRAIHLNDSQNPMGSHKDRHARIGEGTIGLDALVRVLNHPSLCRLPFYLETPCDDAGHGKEIRRLKEALHGI